MGIVQTCILTHWPFVGDTGAYLWDLRYISHGPVRKYTGATAGDGRVITLLREPRHGTLLAGGEGGIACSDFNTGIKGLSLC